jgi:hypothetical protein
MYTLPTFNLVCDVFTPAAANVLVPAGAIIREVDLPCNLAWGRRVNVASTGGTMAPGVPLTAVTLLLPKGADVRGPQDITSADVIEVPAGSGRWYGVYAVDDIGKGFANEHRAAVLLACAGTWTPPYP